MPAKFSVSHAKMMFSDRGHFNPSLADAVSIQIILWATGPVISVTMHSWGNGVVTFPVIGANEGVVYGDDNPHSHMSIAMTKVPCSPPPR